MNEHDDIKDLLDSTVPDGPDLPPAARAASVRRRAGVVRRRQRVALAAAVVAVVGIGVGVPVLVSGGDRDRSQDVAADPSPAAPAAPAPCPAEPIAVSDGVGPEALPDGAASARLCPAVFSAGDAVDGAVTDVLPTAPVTEGLDAFTAGVRALPTYRAPEMCAMTSLAVQPWAIVVSYPDGTSATLGATTTICTSVPVEGVQRDVETIRALFATAAGARDGGAIGGRIGR